VIVDRSGLHKGKPVKTLTEGLTKRVVATTRSHHLRTTRWRSQADLPHGRFQASRKLALKATVERLEYDPNRTAFIALVKYEDGELSYILAPQRLAEGDTVVSGRKADVKPGNACRCRRMPVGTIIHNVEMKPGKGGQIARSAGAYAQLVGRDQGMAICA
jgi:large subunit ribosomal protein L2